jgi:hypothetical protein
LRETIAYLLDTVGDHRRSSSARPRRARPAHAGRRYGL